jgi:hypothetical protein
MYQKTDNGATYAGNPLNGGRASCPAGFTAHQMARCLRQNSGITFESRGLRDQRSGLGDNLFICLPPFVSYRSEIGGFFQIKEDPRTDEIVNNIENPFTGGFSCPADYKRVEVMYCLVPDGRQWGARISVCLLQ